SLIREVFQFSEDSSGKRTGEVHYFGSTNTTAPSRFFLAYFDWNLFKDPASGLFELEITYTGSNKNDSSGQPLWKGGKAVFKNLRFNQKPGMMQFECENANGKKLIYERGQ
ncbi:MAG: hypothetical protein HYY62_08680, partial [Deltaproteobacteria bacterium]|nr:hypothetical protein [Deltaproteobacteria bacterium]